MTETTQQALADLIDAFNKAWVRPETWNGNETEEHSQSAHIARAGGRRFFPRACPRLPPSRLREKKPPQDAENRPEGPRRSQR